jgi:hypothetical protein
MLKYLDARRDAFCAVFDGFLIPSTPPKDHFGQLEEVRRINNIVYSAYECMEPEGNLSALDSYGFTVAQMLELTTLLHPSGISEVMERTVAHTIGSAYTF